MASYIVIMDKLSSQIPIQLISQLVTMNLTDDGVPTKHVKVCKLSKWLHRTIFNSYFFLFYEPG